jgi:hypothetical protein
VAARRRRRTVDRGAEIGHQGRPAFHPAVAAALGLDFTHPEEAILP